MDLKPNPSGIPSRLTVDSTDDAERRLWFDYLKSLNDRRLQLNRSSGFTTYALLGVLAGLVYSVLPQLAKISSTAGAPQATLVTAILLVDIVVGFFGAYAAIL